jgi:hypothetical protein
MNLKLALLQDELAVSKRQIEQLKTTKPKRENFVSGGCCSMDGFHSKKDVPVPDETIFDNKKLLIFLVIVLAAFCIVQYITYRNENRELFEMLCYLVKNNGTPPSNQPTPVKN